MNEDKLPAGWCDVKLSDVATHHSGDSKLIKGKLSSERQAGMHPAYSATGQDVWREAFEQEGSAIIISAVGARCGKCFKADGKWSAIANTHIVWPIEEVADRDFLWFKLNNERFWVRGGSAQPFVKTKESFRHEFGLPPLAEQQRIVEKIETLFAELDKGEEALREVQKLLARYRQSVLKAAVTGTLTADWRAANSQLKENGEDLLTRILEERRTTWQGRGKCKEPVEPVAEGLPELPEGWVWASVEQLATVIGGLTKNKKRGEMPMKRPMLRVANVYQDRLELDDVHESGVTEGELDRVTLRKGDMLVVEGNGSKDQIGRMAVWNGEIPDAVHQNHLIKVRMIDPDVVAFAMKWFQSPEGRQNIELVASSTSGLYTLSISKIERLAVPLPSKDELNEICDRLDEAFARMAPVHDWCEAELNRSAALRQSILKDAFSGKLVPQDRSDEPAEKLLDRIRASREEKPKAKPKKPKA